jgi:hypothetical protein
VNRCALIPRRDGAEPYQSSVAQGREQPGKANDRQRYKEPLNPVHSDASKASCPGAPWRALTYVNQADLIWRVIYSSA